MTGSTEIKTTGEIEVQKSRRRMRRWAFPAMLLVIYVTWFSYMIASSSWHLFQEHWPVSATMTLGSFVAGATAEGGAAIAFPVFTKALDIPAVDARTFGLMIQAVGMTAAALNILVWKLPVLPRVILWVTLGGALGQVLGTFATTIPNPYPRILFTFGATTFGVALIISRWILNWPPQDHLPGWNNRYRALFLLIGLIGGIFAANTGSGIDMLTFIILTLAFGIDEKISTPTTVTIMALNSIVGFALHGLIAQDIGIAFEYWMVAVPIVIIGAPLGAWACSRIKRDHLILFLLSLIGLEFLTTLWLVPIDRQASVIVAIAVGISALWFGAMLRYRKRHFLVPAKRVEPSEDAFPA